METCRICLHSASGQLISLGLRVNNQTAAELVAFCCGIEIDINDGFAQFICSECWPQILTAHKIKTLCIMSDNFLRATFNAAEVCETVSNPVKIKTEPTDFISDKSGSDVVKPEDVSEAESFQDRVNCDTNPVKQEPVEYFGNFESCDFQPKREKSVKSDKKMTKPKSDSKSPTVRKRNRPPTYLNTYKCYICNENFNKRMLKNAHVKSAHSQDDFKCKLCKHKSHTAMGHENHLMLHENPHLRSHMCHICSKNFQRPSKLQRHIVECHTDKSKLPHFFCDLCPFKSYIKPNLTRHMRSLHLKLRDFQCLICPDKKYSSKLSLEHHMITHHGLESDIQCRLCGLKFPAMAYLRAHMRFNCKTGRRRNFKILEYGEQIEGTDSYRCKYCSAVFEGRQKIGLHYRQHHEHSNICDICSAKFYSYANLRKHIRIVHEKDLKYSCSFCGKAFGQRNQMQCHENTHTGEKPYQCKFVPCQFRSGDPSTVIKHKSKCPHNPDNRG